MSLTSRSPTRLAAVVRRRLLVVPAAAVMFVGIGVAAPSAWAAASGTVNTSGVPLNVRATASTTATVVGTLADGAKISIDCQTYGSTVTGTYGTTNIWDHVPAKSGYVSDTYVYTGSDTLVAPLCGGTTAQTCSTYHFAAPEWTCADAVTRAKSLISTKDNPDYYRECDQLVAVDYHLASSSSGGTAYKHWLNIPSTYKHPGDSIVPAGGLAFFSTSSDGHVMISIGNGKFISNDIHGNGTYTETTIAEIKSTWGATYLGWAQPWFGSNH
jgi:uncharacterized protein YraI